ncbi:MAG: MFS transporter [Xanthobacteraceae bacterium]|nr:MFS transporter [Xanthobacteraceae bacterium]
MSALETTRRESPAVALLLLWLSGNALRLTVLAVPPLLALIIVDFKLTGTEVGILNAIPPALFALAAIPGSLLIARVGAVNALVVGLMVTAAGSALRGVAFSTPVLFGATVAMSAGIAVMQPALPPLVRQWAARRIGFATALYTNGLLVGEILPVVFAGALLMLLGGSWRGSLVFWSIWPALIAVMVVAARPRGDEQRPAQHRRWMPDWRDPLLWKVALAMSANNQAYFCTNAFLPGLLLQRGQTDFIGPVLSALNAGQLPASFILLMAASRLERRKWPLVGSGLLGLSGIAVIVFSTSIWSVGFGAALIGFSCAAGLTLLLSLPALLYAPDDVPRVSAGMFTLGYGVAVVISIVGGRIWDITGQAAFAFAPIALAVLPLVIGPLWIDLKRRHG